ncbi:MAG TPA: Rap1a/Tai family immunity protein [Stellaceae bacterium]|jgi:hypothetical protein|nr:Rap1a/Tai family immunity protein [Stellaceae bacterium]
MHGKRFLPVIALCAVLWPVAGHAAVTQDDFTVRSTGDLIDLCSASPSEPMGTAALNFCHGFGLGVVRVLQELGRPSPMFCMPNPPPTRNEAVASFVQWGKSNPSQLNTPAQDGVAAFLAAQYPCTGQK